jgi:LPXTG-site transpeptidase (sortase) family protein
MRHLEFKIFLKYFFFLFFVFYLIFNWNKISWVFNYKALSLTLSNVFLKEKPKEEKREEIISKNSNEKNEFVLQNKKNKLEIPALEISAPIFIVKSTDDRKIEENLNRGVVMFSDYSLPFQKGTTIILGHSAMHDWPKSNPAWVFTYLRDLKGGEEIIINFEGKKYFYEVKQKRAIKEGEDLKPLLTSSNNMLLLITCWPPGRLSSGQRLLVEANLKGGVL